MVFGKYCLLERISVGGMAEVFRAKPLPAYHSDKMLALKRILPHLAEDDEFITMFVDEAKLTVQLEHPNIVETYELGNFQSSYYILMEYIAGEDVLELQKRLRENRRIMSVAQACYVAGKVARGLHYAHTACDEEGRPFNIIHRDVSPQNVRLTWDGRVKLIDFGIAKAAVQRTKTQVGVLKGKFGYMSPEQVHGEEIDHRSDLFALGTTLWEMLTNRRLFNGENEYETLQMVKHPDIARPSEKNSQVPPEVDDIVMRLLAEDRERRFQSGAEAADALQGFVENLRMPYTQRHLADWMAETFSEELAEERRKRELFEQIKSTDDVRLFNREYAGEPAEDENVAGESLVPDGESREQIWDPEFAPEGGEEVDQKEFAADHTQVAAGGFDPEDFEDEQDDLIALDDADIIEVEDESEEQSGGVRSASGRPAGASAEPPHGGAKRASSGERSRERREPRSGGVPDRGGSRRRPPTDASQGEEGSSEGGPSVWSATTARFAFAAAAVVAVFVLALSLGYLAFLAGPDRGEEHVDGAIVVEVQPDLSEEGTILVDNQPRDSRTPATVEGLAPGEHTVEVRFPGFEPATQEVELGYGELGTVEFELSPKGAENGQIELTVPEVDGETRIFVDGEQRSWSVESPTVKVGTGKHLVEATAPGKSPWSRVVEVEEAGMTVAERVEWVDQTASLRIEAEQPAEVTFRGEVAGETPLTVEDLEPQDLHRVELDATEGEDSWESQVGFPELGRAFLAVSLDDTPAYDERDYGWLIASTGSTWWKVLVDRAPTGLITPVKSDGKIPVRAGKRKVSFRRGHQVHEFEIEVEAGETASVVEDLPFEWSPETGM